MDAERSRLGQAMTLDVIVLADEQSTATDKSLTQGARFIVLADGTLHAQSPVRIESSRMPERIRRLRESEIRQLKILSESAIGDANSYELPIALEALHPPRTATLVTVIYAEGSRRVMCRTVHDSMQSDLAVLSLVHHLQDLAWSGNRPVAEVRPGPVRYDLGPDPYARYRRGN